MVSDNQSFTLIALPIRSLEDVMRARQRARQISALLKFDSQMQTRIATAVSEIARNTYQYAKQGKVNYILVVNSPKKAKLTISVHDKGPGIANLSTILSGQPVAGRSGHGITGARRLMDEFVIKSVLGQGTEVTLSVFIAASMLPITQQTVATLANELARQHMYNISDEIQQQNQELLQALNLLNKARNELEERVAQRTNELAMVNQHLLQEIHEHIKTTHSLEQTSQQLKLALQAARMGTWSWHFKSDEITIDHYLSELLNLNIADIPFTIAQFLTHIYPADQAQVKQVFMQAIENSNSFDTEFRVAYQQQNILTLACRGEVVFDNKKNDLCLIGICWDVTERRHAEAWVHKHQQALAQVTYLKLMSEMGSTLAHELNQPLTVVTTFTHGCIRRLQSADYVKEEVLHNMQIVAEQAERAGSIIHHMKDFVRRGKLITESSDINTLIEETITLIKYKVDISDILIKLELNVNLPSLKVDKIQIQQVLINLMQNAIEAMQEAATENATLIIRTTSFINNNEVIIDFIDNGPGFTPETAGKLLDPYFTTKSHDMGMGMGLSISRNIIEAHGGQIIVKTATPGTGAWFKLILPIERQ